MPKPLELFTGSPLTRIGVLFHMPRNRIVLQIKDVGITIAPFALTHFCAVNPVGGKGSPGFACEDPSQHPVLLTILVCCRAPIDMVMDCVDDPRDKAALLHADQGLA